jgi:endogenous inhibitor of DNA gyrase (YacG/DUF329 family)
MTKERRLKCRTCGKLVHRNSKSRYFCSVKCAEAAVKQNNKPENKKRIEAEREGKPLRFAKAVRKERPFLPDDVLSDPVQIPYDRQLTGDPQHDMIADLIDFGRCASETTPEGIRRIDPLSVEEEIVRHNAENPDCPLEFISEPLPTPSPWQGDAPEGTLAHKLKYGEWYKDGHEPG